MLSSLIALYFFPNFLRISPRRHPVIQHLIDPPPHPLRQPRHLPVSSARTNSEAVAAGFSLRSRVRLPPSRLQPGGL